MGEAETEEFARLMRELKERAGLSYGTLARKLHTSTSTLHRYCAGEAVPAEFAVVDRFARTCGAAREEAVDLHRAWLLADARRRSAGRAAPAAGVAGAGAVTGVEPGAASGAGSGVEAGGSGAEPGAGVTGGAPAGAGRWHRRRGVAVGAAGAAALSVAVAVLVAAGPGPRTPGAGPAGAAGSTAGPAVGTAGPAGTPSVWASTPPATSTPAPVPSGSTGTDPGTDPGPGTGPGSGAGATAPSPAPPSGPVATPLKAAVRSHVWAAGCDHAYLSERAPESVPAPPVEADAPAWARAQRAVHAGTQTVEVTLHGTGEGAVVLQGLEVRVDARRTPPPWNVYQMSPGCGGGLTPAGFAVNLDAPRPLARPVAGNDAGTRLPAPAFPLRVSATDPVVLRVTAAATGCDCDWHLELRWSGPGGSGTLRLDDDGVPWRTSATAGRPEYGFAGELGRWAR
ncbi:helix-turn-helix domain-containing protein [Streptomyces sp. NPDC012794]|uniref:helix-turn-helix domain-containing protein n=1 Tax=Streptomyces sp. NPDC012794 TaxID=3364850 RepID=UPI0036A37DF8